MQIVKRSEMTVQEVKVWLCCQFKSYEVGVAAIKPVDSWMLLEKLRVTSGVQQLGNRNKLCIQNKCDDYVLNAFRLTFDTPGYRSKVQTINIHFLKNTAVPLLVLKHIDSVKKLHKIITWDGERNMQIFSNGSALLLWSLWHLIIPCLQTTS